MASRWFLRKRTRGAAPADPGEVLALGYLRVSTKKQDKGFSPEAQQKEVAAYVRQRGWEPGPMFRDTLQGTREDRPDYQRMLEQVRFLRKQGRHVVVVAAALDRTGRDLAELFGMRKALRQLGVQLHYTRDGGELDDDSAMLKGWQAAKETEKLSIRVSASKKTIADLGLPPSGPASWGYRWRYPQTEREEREFRVGKQVRRVLDVHEAEAPSVREAFARVTGGESLMAVLRWVSGLPDGARGGRRLGQYPLKAILQNPIYIARYDRDGSATSPEEILALPQGRWPALVSDETWLAVQRQLAASRKLPQREAATYLLTGFARCPKCQTKMHGDPNTGYPRYRCESRNRGAGLSNSRCVTSADARKLDAAVLDDVGRILDCVAALNDPAVRADLEPAWDALHAPPSDTAAELQEVEERIRKLRGRLVRSREDLYDGQIDDAEFELLTSRAKAALAVEEARRRALVTVGDSRGGRMTLDEALARAGTWSVMLRNPDVSIQAKRVVLAELIESLRPVALKKGKGGKYAARLSWTPAGQDIADFAERVGALAAAVSAGNT